jgi:phosphoribosylanthranilate isomerase
MNRRTWIKICGITRPSDLAAAVEAGVDAVGFVFAESPRRLTADAARRLVMKLPPHVLRIGVFVDENPSEIARVAAAAELDRIQLHGFEDPMIRELIGTRVLKAFRARDPGVLDEIPMWGADTFMLDSWSANSPGGTGATFDWSIAKKAASLGRMIMAGGLTPENVGRAIAEVRPFGVDVSTGVETSPGIKDPAKIRAFVDAVRAADAELASSAASSSSRA